MRALLYHGPEQTSWDTVPDPAIEEATDAIVRVEATTVCGSDLHILRGDLPEVKPGTILGHEAVGEVMEVGGEVHDLRRGDQVIVSSVSACGHCRACRDTTPGQCRGGGGWILGNLINGTQAEFVRVPFADYSTRRRPWDLPLDDAVLLAEVLPTAYEVGVRNGHVCPGDTVVVVGAGPRRPRCGDHRAAVLAPPDHRGGPGRCPAGGRAPCGGRCRRAAGEDDRRTVRGTRCRRGH